MIKASGANVKNFSESCGVKFGPTENITSALDRLFASEGRNDE